MFEMFNFVDWYLGLPLPAQIAVVAGGIAVAILAIILAVYLIKWTILAIIYLIKGIVKAIKWGGKKIKEAANAPCCPPTGVQEKDPFAEKGPVASPAPIRAKTPEPSISVKVPESDNVPRFCAQCGTPLDANIRTRLATGQSAFCAQCGTPLFQEETHAPASVPA